MGNQQSKKHQTQVEPIKEIIVETKEITPRQENFVLEIQNENERNVNQRKSISVVHQENSAPPAPNHAPHRMSKKQASKKELPPLKLKSGNSLKTTPLGNCQNTTNQASNMGDELQEVHCEKGSKQVIANYLQGGLDQLEDKDREGQKQNNEAASNARAKKFRPSQSSMKKNHIPSNATINDAREVQQIPEVAVL